MLGDAGMVLRDPSTAHLLAHQVLACSPLHHSYQVLEHGLQGSRFQTLQSHQFPPC